MTPVVIDSSVTLAWFFEDEVDPYSESVLESLQRVEALVPALWPFEVANVLLVSERRRRQTADQTAEFTRLLSGLPITVDDAITGVLWGRVLVAGRQHSLSAYDASYLELAERHGAPLATMDDRLRAAARDHGVALAQGPA